MIRTPPLSRLPHLASRPAEGTPAEPGTQSDRHTRGRQRIRRRLMMIERRQPQMVHHDRQRVLLQPEERTRRRQRAHHRRTVRLKTTRPRHRHQDRHVERGVVRHERVTPREPAHQVVHVHPTGSTRHIPRTNPMHGHIPWTERPHPGRRADQVTGNIHHLTADNFRKTDRARRPAGPVRRLEINRREVHTPPMRQPGRSAARKHVTPPEGTHRRPCPRTE